jgi:L-alanine-DL-glutamate epimerase-like enolase superfamily enzyme
MPNPFRLERVRATLVSVPLSRPYELSFGNLTSFDTIVVEVGDDDGHAGIGEATITPGGYTPEILDECWPVARGLVDSLTGKPSSAAKASLVPLAGPYPFTATAFATAIEMAEGSRLLEVETRTLVPILGLVQGADEAALAADMDRLFALGFRTLKFKVGTDVERDLARVALVQSLLGGRGTIRLDANCGYSRDEACRFAAALAPDGIELFEQPCPSSDWEAAWSVAQVARVPMMLDESIYGLDDIARAAELGAAAYIKVKLMKLGGLAHLATGLEMIQARGMRSVLGNGVAHDVGCWMEACVARGRLHNAGEMNGFLKPVASYLEQPLKFESGSIVLEPGWRPTLDRATFDRFTQAAYASSPVPA